MRKAKLGEVAGRGVWVAPFTSINRHMILLAFAADGRRLAEREIPPGCNSLEIMEELLDLLDREDPDPKLRLRAI